MTRPLSSGTPGRSPMSHGKGRFANPDSDFTRADLPWDQAEDKGTYNFDGKQKQDWTLRTLPKPSKTCTSQKAILTLLDRTTHWFRNDRTGGRMFSNSQLCVME